MPHRPHSWGEAPADATAVGTAPGIEERQYDDETAPTPTSATGTGFGGWVWFGSLGGDCYVARQIAWGAGLAEPAILIDTSTAGDNASTSTEEFLYYRLDALGSVIGLTDEQGDLVERYTYDPYGQVHIETNSGGWTWRHSGGMAASKYDNPLAFTGHRFDAATGLHAAHFRHYSPRLGRWLSRDPAGYIDGVNLYEYVGGMPVGAVDPLGLYRIDKVRCEYLGYEAWNYYEYKGIWPWGGWVHVRTVRVPLGGGGKDGTNEDDFNEAMAKCGSNSPVTVANFGSSAGDAARNMEVGAKGVMIGTTFLPGPDDAAFAAYAAAKGFKWIGKVLYRVTKRGKKIAKATEAEAQALTAGYKAENAVSAPMTGVKEQLQKLAKGKQSHVRTVRSDSELKDLYESLTQGGKTVDPGGYPGTVRQLSDGTVVRMRSKSKSGGATIDITYPDGTSGKVHVE